MMAVLRRIRTLAMKELLVLLRDPRGRSTLIVPPIIQLLLFAYAVTLEVNNVSVTILNLDMGLHGHEISERVSASPYFSSITFADRPQVVGQTLERQESLLAICLPQDFSRTITAGSGASLQALSDGRRSNAAQIVSAYLADIVNQYSMELADGPAGTVQAEGRHWFNQDLVYVWTIIPSLMAIITLIMTLNISAMSLAREKELGTFEQLLVSPYSPAEIIIGKLIPAMLLAVFESMLIFVLGRLLYGVPMRGSFLLLLASIVGFSFSVIGFGFFTSSIVKTQQQAIVGAFMFMVPSVALSGFSAPVENMPAWLQKAVILNPLKHALVIFKGIFLKDMPASEVWLNAWPMLAIGAVSLVFSGWLFRRNLG
jgi:ABC-2 type transport system permease protein